MTVSAAPTGGAGTAGDRLHRQGLRARSARPCSSWPRYRLPEWTDRSPADLGVLLVDLFAYVGDVVCYYQDRIASESFLDDRGRAAQRHAPAAADRLRARRRRSAATAELTSSSTPPGPGEPTAVTHAAAAPQFATKPPPEQRRPRSRSSTSGRTWTIDLAAAG